MTKRVRLTEHMPALAMTTQHIAAADFGQHAGRDRAGEGAFLLGRAGLGAERYRAVGQEPGHLCEPGVGREDRCLVR